ncbi:MAG: murein hydrolase activator EnvC family protein [Marinilabiliaceae bacterium]
MRIAHFLIALLLVPAAALAQSGQKTLDDLNREKARLQSIIEQNNKMMDEYKTRKNNEMMRISVVDNKIARRRQLIDLYNSEIEAYNGQIRKLNQSIDSVGRALKRQKQEYADILRQLQLHGSSYSPLAFILSSSSFNQSYRRLLFMRQYSEYRRTQFEKLEASKADMARLKGVVSDKLVSINQVLAKVRDETTQLNNELAARQGNVEQISKSQVDLQKQIKDAQAQTKKLEERIVAVIREEAERARREAEEAERKRKAAKASGKTETAKNTAPEPLSEQIIENKGRLPWPVRSFVITSRFGEHDHPLVPQIKISNNGVDMDILASKDIHPVHKGKVSRIIVVPGSCATIIVRHGEILTVYSNLEEVYVKKDQEVDVYTNLGRVYTGDGINSNILHFEIWKGEAKQDPELWLRKQ